MTDEYKRTREQVIEVIQLCVLLTTVNVLYTFLILVLLSLRPTLKKLFTSNHYAYAYLVVAGPLPTKCMSLSCTLVTSYVTPLASSERTVDLQSAASKHQRPAGKKLKNAQRAGAAAAAQRA